MVGILQALPGTKLYERMKREGRLLNGLSGDNADGHTNIIPKMDSELLRKGYMKMMLHLYTPKNYYRRIRTLLTEYHVPELNHGMRLSQLMAFARSVVLLGIVGRERFQYWNMLFWTFLKHRRALPLAVTLAIYGHHFRKVSQLYIRKGDTLADPV
jgi:hypothetical protein